MTQSHSQVDPPVLDPELAVRRLQQQLADAPRGTRPAMHAALQYRLGMATAELPTGDRGLNLSTALRHYDQAAALFRPGSAPLEHARVQNARGAALKELGQTPQAVVACRMAVDLMTDRAPVWERAAAMNNLGLALSDIGRHEEAMDALTQAVRDFETVALTDQQTDNPSGTAPQRVMAHHNLGQVFASAGRHDEAVGVYRDALTTIDPQELPYQWGLIHHALGVSLTAVEDPHAASASFETALKVFSRMRHPFQHALAKNNVGLAYAQIGDVVSLRRAVTAFNDSMAVLDPRVHRELWQQAYANMQLAEQSLVQLGHDDTLTQHFVKLLAHLAEHDRMDMMRDRLMRLLSLPEPQRGEALTKMDLAALELDEQASIAVTIAGLAVLLELPDELLSLGLKSRMAAIDTITDELALDDAAWVIEQSISGGMLAPQRIRLRDRLEEAGYERR